MRLNRNTVTVKGHEPLGGIVQGFACPTDEDIDSITPALNLYAQGLAEESYDDVSSVIFLAPCVMLLLGRGSPMLQATQTLHG